VADLNGLRLVADQDPLEQYAGALEAQIASLSPALLQSDRWGRDLISDVFKVPEDRLAQMRMSRSEGRAAVISFEALPRLFQLEMKAYFGVNLADPRSWGKDWLYRRRDVLQWLSDDWREITGKFGAAAMAEFPHPMTTPENLPWCDHSRENSEPVMAAFAGWHQRVRPGRNPLQQQTYAKGKELVTRTYYSGNIAVVGAVQMWLIVNRERVTKPLDDRDVILLSDLFSEDDTRFEDVQRTRHRWVQFYRYPEWLRPAVRAFVLDKVAHNEYGPTSVYTFSVSWFRDFLYERFDEPRPSDITVPLIEDAFLAWGNERKLAGKNWWTDVARMIEFAGRKWPDRWPALSFSDRATRKIKRRQAADFGGRLHASREGGGRSTPKVVVDRLAAVINEAPSPIPALFCLGVATGARREDLHAFLFDCLRDDPSDPDFMILHFWQNKVRKWNQKPLLRSDPVHKQVIDVVEARRAEIIRQYGGPTKYLFPVFYGGKESFLSPEYSADELKQLCIRHDVRDDKGEVYNFTWHPLRHHRGTEMALAGYDTLSIMFELGHSSPSMAMTYINHRLELRKKALIEKGGGRFVDIQGRVDDSVGQLLQRKDDARRATRVCGGACMIPEQIGEWCEHAHACLTCKHFRADSNDIQFFRSERLELLGVVEQQQQDIASYGDDGKSRLAEIAQRRQERNKKALANVTRIIAALESDGAYTGAARNFRPAKELPLDG